MPAAAPSTASARADRLAALLGCGWLLKVLLFCAWHADDAWLTHRTARNLLDGLGPVWNAGERVAAYTHPLWLGVSALCQALTGEPWASVLGVSLALCLAVAALMSRLAPAGPVAVALLLWSASQAAVDYGVSGLENPLLYLLLVLAVRRAERGAGVGEAALLFSAAALTRPDAALFLGPLLLLRLARDRALLRGCLGLLPLLAWEGFSLVYYGSLVPNTAIAKLNLNIPRVELLAQGLAYGLDWVGRDPVGAAALLGGLGWSLARGRAELRALAAGVLLYLLYIPWVGGDFMAGRFFAAPVVAALALGLAAGPPGRRALLVVAAGAAALGLLRPASPWRSDLEHGVGWTKDQVLSEAGISDERAYYYPSTGLLRILRDLPKLAEAGLPLPPNRGARLGLDVAASGQKVARQTQVGIFGYFAGPGVYVLDVYALGDPLLARMPFEPSKEWRPGHYERIIPDGYTERLEDGHSELRDPALEQVYQKICLITRGPLWSAARWQAIGESLRGAWAPTLAQAARGG